MASTGKYVGKDVTDVRSVNKVTGATIYAADVNLPGMLHGVMIRSEYAHALVTGIDITEAMKVDGVVAIVTYKDFPELHFGTGDLTVELWFKTSSGHAFFFDKRADEAPGEVGTFLMIDPDGLPLVSTLHSPNLEESLGAFGASAVGQMERAQDYFDMGPLYLLHLAGRDRQLFVTPLTPEVSLLAIAEAGATASTVTLHLLGLCREVLSVLQASDDDELEATE